MVTIKDVAKYAGVSIATVSRVLNRSPKASQEAILVVERAVQALGYRPNAAAQALVSQCSNAVGVVVADVSDPFFGALVKASDKVASAHGKHLLIGNGFHDAAKERRAIEFLINSRCDALVVHAKALQDEELVAYAREVKSFIVINRYVAEIAERCVFLNNHLGAFIATQHLLEKGHRHIACISSTHAIEDVQERILGYQAALVAQGLSLPESYIVHATPDSAGGELAMEKLLDEHTDITAVVAYNDYMAAGALCVARKRGIVVPEQLSIVGFDDGLIARYLYPKLTTVRYPIVDMAKMATQLALDLAYDKFSNASSLSFSPGLIERDSVMAV
ncbi:MAG: substrate-binding domain-containing protein [Vibrionaceae bacterium]